MKRTMRRILSWVLILAMVLTSNTFTVFAEEFSEGSKGSVEEQAEVLPSLEQSVIEAADPQQEPTAEPTVAPVAEPAVEATAEPTTEPTVEPTTEPTAEPTEESAVEPTAKPTEESAVEPAAEPTEEPAQEPAALFEQGYVRVFGGTKVYREAQASNEIGLFLSDANVYAFVERRGETPADNWLKIVFDTQYNRDHSEPLCEGFVRGDRIAVLSADESACLENMLSNETNVRTFRGMRLPAAQYESYDVNTDVPEEDVIEETTSEESAEVMEEGAASEETDVTANTEAVSGETDEESDPESNVYAFVKASERVYSDAGLTSVLGTFEEGAAVYISARENYTLTIQFAVDGELLSAYLDASKVEILPNYVEENGSVFFEEVSLRNAAFSFEETQKKFEKGYVCLPAGTAVYSSPDFQEEVGTVNQEAIVYAIEVSYSEDSDSAEWYKVVFDTEDESLGGYVQGQAAAVLNENEIADVAGRRKIEGFTVPVITFTKKIQGLSDGLWVYEVVDGNATVLGYLDYEAASLSIPDQLGGYYVNAIGEKAFQKNTALVSMYIHGNVLSIADDAFASKNVTLSGYNGTEVLAYAKDQGMPSENRTNLDGITLQAHVVDFSYADGARYEYTGEFTIRMNKAEAENLKNGSIFYIPKVYGQLMRVYKVESISVNSEYAVISVSEASLEETFVHLAIADELTPDWSSAVWAEGVEVVQEKVEGELETNHKIVVNFTRTLGERKTKNDDGYAKVVLTGNAEIGLTGSMSVDVSVLPVLSLNSFDFKVDLDGQISGGLEFGADTDDIGKSKDRVEKTRNGYFKTGDLSKIEKAAFDQLLCKVGLGNRTAKTKAYIGIYIRVGVSGEIKLVTKLHGTLLQISYEKGRGWSRNHSVQWNPLSISAAVDVDFGLVAIAEADFFGIGRIATFEAFAGLNIGAEANMDILKSLAADYTTAGNAGGSTAIYENALICADIKINAKVELSFSTSLKWFKEIIDKKTEWNKTRSDKWAVLTLTWKIKSWHLEAKLSEIFSKWKSVDACTNSFVTVDFYTGTGEKLNTIKLQNNTTIGAKAPVVITDPNDKTTYGLRKVIGELEGWYVYENCSGPSEYANGVGSKRKWDFGKDKVSDNMTLYAEWRSDTSYPVIYKANFTSKDPAKPVPDDIKQQAIEGALLMNPGQMKRDEYRFKGWFLDAAATKEWNFNSDVVTQDKLNNGSLILYAGWEYEAGYDPNAVEEESHGRMSFNGHSYTHIMQYKSYAEAEADAKRQGGYLCTINSAEEQAFLQKYLYEDCAQTYLWLGMTSNDGWNYWKTGEPVTYTNWRTPPAATANQFNAAIVRSSGQWTTLSNSDTAHYVIEWGTPATDPNYKKTIKSDLSFTPNGDGKTATVTGIAAGLFVDKKTISIPSVSPDGLRVTGIAADAFKGNSKLESISIPNTVTSIQRGAFENCTKLTSVTIPGSVTSIGTNVFKGCTSLENVVWSSAITEIPSSMFDGDNKLVSISNISNVTSINDYAFRNVSSMNSFTFPAKLTTIGQSAFDGASSLREIVLPDSVTTIGQYAFRSCTSAFKISLPDNMTSIGYYSFYNCRSASDIYLPQNIARNQINNYAFQSVNGTFHVYRGTGSDEWCKARGKTIEYLGSQQKIKFSAGEGPAYEPTAKDGDMLTEIYIEVGKRITEPVIEREGMTIEGWYLEPEFINKWDFAADKVPEHSITLYAKWVSVSNVFTYDISSGIARITGYTGSTEQVLIPDQIDGYIVTSIGKDAFTGNDIREIVIPASVTSIASGAFDCTNLETITLRSDKFFSVHEDGVLYLKSGRQLIYAPQGRMYSEYTVPETVTNIRNYAFRGHAELEKIFIPDSVTAIGANTFERNHTVTIYGSLNSCAAKIHAEANLLPYNMYIVHYLYDGGELFTGLQQAGTLIEEYFEPMTDFFSFGGWYKDAHMTQEWDFTTDIMPQGELTLYLKWDTLFDIAVSGNTINITGYRGNASSIIIPDQIGGKTVVGIDSGAFLLTNAKTIQVPDTVVTIEDAAFPTTATIVSSADSIARTYAINNNLKYKDTTHTIHFEVDGGSEVSDINLAPGKKTALPTPIRSNYYFYGWYTDTTYMDSVRWTEDSVMPENDITLYACWRSATTGVTNDFAYNLLSDGTIEVTGYSGTKTALSIPNKINGYTVSRIGECAFESNDTIVSIVLPNTVSSIGKYAFAESVVRTVKGAAALSDIEEGAFRGASSLTSIALTTNLRNIGNYAFQRCSSLTSFTLPKGTISVGFRAFNDCEYLDTVNITTTLTYLGKEAFSGCPRLKSVFVPTALLNTARDAFDDDVTISYKTSVAINFLDFEIRGNEINVSWNKVQNASTYALESKRSANKTYARRIETSDTNASLALGAYGVTYDVKIVALDSNGAIISESLPTTAYLSKLGTPSITSVTQLTESSATMVLAPVNGVDGYEVERAFSERDEFSLLKSVTATSFRNTGLVKGFDYYYRVRAYTEGSDGERTYSRYSDVFHFQMPYKYVVAPENVVAIQTSGNAARISWNDVADAEGYLVYRSVNGGAFRQLRDTPATFTTNVSLPKGRTFSYKVAAYFEEGGTRVVSKESEIVTITVRDLATPEITEIRQTTATGISLSWTSVKDATGYKLYKATSADGDYVWVKNISGSTSTTFSSGLTSGNTYYFVVRAFKTNEDGTISDSADSPVVSINFSSVAQASGLKVSQTAGAKAKLTWNAISNVDGYEVWMSAVNRNGYELVTTATSRAASLEDLNDGVTYYFKIRGYKGTGDSKELGLFSEEVSVTMFGTPELQVVEQNGKSSVQLIWDKVNSADGYEIWRKTGAEEYTLVKTITVNSATVYSHTAGSSYSYKVRPYKLDDSKKSYGYDSNVKSVYILGTTKITSLIRSGGAAVTLTWDKVTGATGYNLYRCNTIDGVFAKIKSTTELTISNTGLVKGSTYYFKIVPYRTVNGVQVEGIPTAVKGIRLLDRPAITAIEQTAATTLTLTWTEVPMATSYRLYRSEKRDGEYTFLKKVTGATTATSINLTADKWYYYKVEAGIDEDGTTYYSQMSVPTGAYVTSLAIPTISSITQANATSAKLTWKKVEGANGYEVLRSSKLNGPYSSVKVLTATGYTDKELIQGATYYYKVRPYKTVNGTKAYGRISAAMGACILPEVELTSVERTASKRVDLYWEAVARATGYNVYRSSSKDGKYTLLKTVTDTTAYNTGLTLGGTYYYRVAAVFTDGAVNNIGPMSTAVGITLTDIGSTSITSVKQTKSATVELKWIAVAGAEGYEISMAKGGETAFSWVKNTTGTTTTTSVNLTDGDTFQYRVRAYVVVDGKKEFGAYSSLVSIALLAAPSVNSVYQTASNRVDMDWASVNGATGYEVYRKTDNGSYKKIKSVTENSANNSALAIGTKYTYKVRAYRMDGNIKNYSGFSNEISITPIRYSTGSYPESTHDYSSNMDETWSYSIAGAEALRVTFVTETSFEHNFDRLYITDKNGNTVGSNFYSGTQLAGKTIIVPGDTINLRMTTDGSITRYGFAIESIVPAGR